jgi:flavin-dependent dehydrogenase
VAESGVAESSAAESSVAERGVVERSVAERVFDVAVVGGGPAGCATALALRAHAPGLGIVLLEASAYDRPRLGETLPPLTRRLLAHLGVWDAFQRQSHREVHGTAAAWGSAAPWHHDYLFSAQGPGWHLDRAAFDAMLAATAEGRGVTVLRRTRVTHADRRGDLWQLRLRGGDGGFATARFLVDATGPSAALARRSGARFAAADRLTGYARFFEDAASGAASDLGDPRTLVEAVADGWWYTAGLPGGLRIAAFLTDADLARRLSLADPAHWMRHLAATDGVRALLRGARPRGPVVVRPAHSRQLLPAAGAAGEGWMAVGDAASLFDPLSSQGILKGLRSGIFAAYAIGDLLARGEGRGLEAYARHVREEFASYRRARTRYYAEERRWLGSEFWRRRAAA